MPDTGQVSELTRFEALTDEQWAVVEPLLPSNEGRKGRPFTNNRRIVNGIIYRYCTGIPWRDLPREQYGPWQTVWKRHRSYARRGVWDHVLSHVISQADTRGEVDWAVSIDATINRAHQHQTPRAGHRGRDRTTRNLPPGKMNPQVTALVGPEAG